MCYLNQTGLSSYFRVFVFCVPRSNAQPEANTTRCLKLGRLVSPSNFSPFFVFLLMFLLFLFCFVFVLQLKGSKASYNQPKTWVTILHSLLVHGQFHPCRQRSTTSVCLPAYRVLTAIIAVLKEGLYKAKVNQPVNRELWSGFIDDATAGNFTAAILSVTMSHPPVKYCR